MSGNNQQFYLGAQDASSNTTDENAIAFIVERLMNRRTHVELVQVMAVTNMPGQVAAVGQVNVLPLVNQIDGFGNARPHMTVNQLSYFRYAGGNSAVILDPQVGDIGFAVIADKDTSVVKATQKQGNPGSRGRSRREYGIYLGLCLGNANPNQYLAFQADGLKILDKSGNSITMNSSGMVLTDKFGHTLTFDSSGIHANVTVTSTRDVVAGEGTSNTIPLLSHIHSDPQGGNTGPPMP